MKSIIETIRGARFIELLLLIVVISALALVALGGGERGSTDKTDMESRLERLLERIDGVGDVDVMISTDGEGRPLGVAVVADKRLDVRARLEIQSAIQALMDIELQRIRVIGRGGIAG